MAITIDQNEITQVGTINYCKLEEGTYITCFEKSTFILSASTSPNENGYYEINSGYSIRIHSDTPGENIAACTCQSSIEGVVQLISRPVSPMIKAIGNIGDTVTITVTAYSESGSVGVITLPILIV